MAAGGEDAELLAFEQTRRMLLDEISLEKGQHMRTLEKLDVTEKALAQTKTALSDTQRTLIMTQKMLREAARANGPSNDEANHKYKTLQDENMQLRRELEQLQQVNSLATLRTFQSMLRSIIDRTTESSERQKLLIAERDQLDEKVQRQNEQIEHLQSDLEHERISAELANKTMKAMSAKMRSLSASTNRWAMFESPNADQTQDDFSDAMPVMDDINQLKKQHEEAMDQLKQQRELLEKHRSLLEALQSQPSAPTSFASLPPVFPASPSKQSAPAQSSFPQNMSLPPPPPPPPPPADPITDAMAGQAPPPPPPPLPSQSQDKTTGPPNLPPPMPAKEKAKKPGGGIAEALKRRENVKLVKNKEMVLAVINEILSKTLTDIDMTVAWFNELDERLSDLATGESWQSKLVIKKKGGGFHFSDSELSEAGKAYDRVSCLFFACTWTTSLIDAEKKVKQWDSIPGQTRDARLTRMIGLLEHCMQSIQAVYSAENFKSELQHMQQFDVPHRFDELEQQLKSTLKDLVQMACDLGDEEIEHVVTSMNSGKSAFSKRIIAMRSQKMVQQCIYLYDLALYYSIDAGPGRKDALEAGLLQINQFVPAEDDNIDDEEEI